MLLSYLGHMPTLGVGVFTAANADIIGRVNLGEDASIFFQCVLRGDINSITVGARSNIQDHCVMHVADDFSCVVGDDVSVGHGCILHACAIGHRVLVGMGSVIMDGAQIGSDSVVAAGSLVSKGKLFAPGSLILGNPARVIRTLTAEEKAGIVKLATKYVGIKNNYLNCT